MQNSGTWRDLLRKIIENPHERQRIANEVGVSPVTLTRWVNGDSTPRASNIRLLLRAVPEYRKDFVELLKGEYGDLSREATDIEDSPQEIPSFFYARILRAHADTPRVLRFISICEFVLPQALKQLDPNRVGMEIAVIRCMPPSLGNVVCSLREIVAWGTPPWKPNLEYKTLFLGAESLAGHIVTTGRLLAVQNAKEGESLYPALWLPYEHSAAGYPIRRGGLVVGCLLCSCAEPDYFLASRQELIRSYAELIALAFEHEEFYDWKQIALHFMPPPEEQKQYLADFRQRLSTLMIESVRRGQPMDVVQAEELVWRQIEEDMLLHLSSEATQI